MNRNVISKPIFADLILLFVTLCWGVTFPLIEDAVKLVSPSVFVMVRFFIAAFFLLPIVIRNKHLLFNKEILLAGLVLGFFNAICYLTQTIGMAYVTSAQGAFITGMSVVIVPFVLPVFSQGKPLVKDVLCSLICLLGLYVLMGGHLSAINNGAVWIFACAIATSFSIVYLQKVSRLIDSLSLLVFYQILFTGLFVSPFSMGKNFSNVFSMTVVVAIIFCALVATCLALFLQTKYQQYTSASRAAMIYCFEPIFATIFGLLINGEQVTSRIFWGGLLVLLGVLLSECYSIIKNFVSHRVLLTGFRQENLEK